MAGREEGEAHHTWKKTTGGKTLREGVLKAEGTGVGGWGGKWRDGIGVNYALQRIFGLFTHAAHIRSVLKFSYLLDCFFSSQPELPAKGLTLLL